MNQIFKILKTIALLTLLVAALSVLGTYINNIIIWQWLTDFFILIRKMILLFDFGLDTDILISLTTSALLIEASLWVFKQTLLVVNYFKE